MGSRELWKLTLVASVGIGALAGCDDGGVCGNGAVEGAEVCDGSDLRGLTCADAGFDAGVPGCSQDCSAIVGCTHAPIAVADDVVSFDGAPVMVDVAANDEDPDGDPLSVTFVGGASRGAVALQDGKAMYVPQDAGIGTDTFAYRISDGVLEAEGVVTVHLQRTLTLSGTAVAADPLAQASVVVHVGARTYSTTAGADGAYVLTVGGESNDELITIFARGASSSGESFIELASLPGAFGDLRAVAGADLVLTRAEHTGVQVTPGTTGRHAALVANNGGVGPADPLELAETEQNAGLVATWGHAGEAAGAILLVVEGNAVLPAAYDTTLELALDLVEMRAFVEGLRASAAPADPVTEAFRRLAADPSSGADFPASLAPGVYAPGPMRSHNGVIAAGWERQILGADGTGSMQLATLSGTVPSSTPITWAVTSGDLVVELASPIAWYEYLTAEEIAALYADDPTLQGEILAQVDGVVPVWTTSSTQVLGRIAEGVTTDLVARTWVDEYYLRSALAPYGIDAPDRQREVSYAGGWAREDRLRFAPLDEASLLGTWAMSVRGSARLPAYYPAGALVLAHALVELSSDGTATISSDEVTWPTSLAWQLLEDGSLQLTYPDGSTQRVRLWGQTPTELGFMSWHRLSTGEQYVSYDCAVKVVPGFALSDALLENAAGEYWQNTINYAAFDLGPDGEPPLDWLFGFVFGTGDQVARFFVDYTDYEAKTGPYVWLEDWWRSSFSSGLAMIELRSDSTRTRGCSMGDPSCVVLRRRTWKPVAQLGSWVYVLEDEVARPDYWRFTNGTYTWNASLGRWQDATGTAVDMTSWESFTLGRLQAYHVRPLPQL